MTALQDLYPEDASLCFGCGRLNAHGLHVRTEFHDGEGTARFQPQAHHCGTAGFVYGGLIASLIDCHAIATAAGITMVRQGAVPGRDPTPRFVSATLYVDFLQPTPMGRELVLKARATNVGSRSTTIETRVFVGDVETARGRVIAVETPPTMRTPPG